MPRVPARESRSMTQRGYDISGYIEVNERIQAFKAAHPEGSLQAEIHLLNDSVVVMKASAYRTPDDPRPGVGWSSLQIPGATPFTRGSEIENCETSAWGRAIAALGFEVKRGIATSHEVQMKQQQRPQAKSQNGNAPSGNGIANVGGLLNWALTSFGMTRDEVLAVLDVNAPADIKNFSDAVVRIEAAVKEVAPA